MAKKKPGRPKVKRSEYKGKFVHVRLTTSEHRLLTKAAAHDDVRLSEWIRRVLLQRARRKVQ